MDWARDPAASAAEYYTAVGYATLLKVWAAGCESARIERCKTQAIFDAGSEPDHGPRSPL